MVVVFGQVGNAQHFVGKQKEINKILTNIEQFSGYIMESDYEKIAGAYTDNGKIFPGNTMILEGKALIEDYWRLPEGTSITYHKVTPSEIKIMGKEAYDYGYYEGRTKRSNGEEVAWKGKYVIVWRKVNKDWKIYLDIWNRVGN